MVSTAGRTYSNRTATDTIPTGTALFVSIGGGLNKAGPGGLFMAYTIYSIMLGMVNNGIAEMTTHMPVSGGFIRLAGTWVDDAFGFMAGWNFFIYVSTTKSWLMFGTPILTIFYRKLY